MIESTVRADSVSPDGRRITTLEVTMPRFILAQFNTHRMFSRNAASSRAIPTRKMLDRIKDDPFVPKVWGRSQKGMVAGDPLPPADQNTARFLWANACVSAIRHARSLADLGVAKEHVNRLLEPFTWVTVLVTATEWENFFRQRLHHAAQPEMQEVARSMHAAIEASSPRRIGDREWHMPFGERMPDGADLATQLKIATARCCRISYLTHDGEFSVERDIQRHDDCLTDGHLSPFEHCARVAFWDSTYYANFRGWESYRYLLERQYPIERANRV